MMITKKSALHLVRFVMFKMVKNKLMKTIKVFSKKMVNNMFFCKYNYNYLYLSN